MRTKLLVAALAALLALGNVAMADNAPSQDTSSDFGNYSASNLAHTLGY